MAISTGDRVRWNTSQGTTEGVAKERRTATFQFAKQKFNATEDDPYWLVQSSSTGAMAAHRESSLEPVAT